MSFLKNVSIHDKLNRIIMLTTGIALLFAALSFCLFDLLAYRNSEARELGSVAEIIGAHSTASLRFQDPISGQETLRTLNVDPRVIAARLYTQEGKVFASYHRDRKSRIVLPAQPRSEGNYFEQGQILIFRPILLDGKKVRWGPFSFTPT